MMKYISTPLIVVLLTCCNSHLDSKNADSLEDTILQFNEAFQQADVGTLSALITDNYVHTNGSMKSFGKEDWLSYLKTRRKRIESGELRVDRYEFTDVSMIVSSESAFVTGKIISEGVDDEVVFKNEIRVSNYWILHNGSWK